MALFRLFLVVSLCATGLFGKDIFDLQNLGLYTLVLRSHLIKCEFNKSLNLDVSLLRLYMYDFKNDIYNSYYLNESASAILNDTNFDPNRRTFLYVPGLNETIDSSSQNKVRENLKDVPNSYLYIVDHHNYTHVNTFLDYLSSYERSVKYYFDIGRAIAEFLDELVAGGVWLDGITVMGHSLGGQIIGAVGEVFYNRTDVFLPRLLGSDPAGPCFSKADTGFQLRSGIARHVETYHCNAGQLGTKNNLADASYYVNGGEDQPGCKTPFIPTLILSALASECSHNCCPKMLTLPSRFQGIWKATLCNSEKAYKSGACANNGTTSAGVFSNVTNVGKYFFKTTGYDIL